MLRDEPIFAVPMKKWNSTKDCSVVAKESRKQKLQKWVGVAWRAFFGYFLFTQKKVTSKLSRHSTILFIGT
jgi:hypothetical protein